MDKLKIIGRRILSDLAEFRFAILLFGIYYFVVRTVTGAFCPIVIMTGFPCPGCGLTRAFLFLLTGQTARAIRANPSVLFWILFLLYFIVQRYVRGKEAKSLYYLLGMVSLATVLIFVWRMAVVFPNRPPMAITPGSVLAEISPCYDGFLNNIQRYGILKAVKKFHM